jgi:molybdopterin-guanine dinucleotide biosynthesis protein A
MGMPKQLVSFGHSTLGEIAANALQAGIAQSGSASLDPVALGTGVLPPSMQYLIQLADAPDLAGPLAGLLAAHRWSPRTAWIVVACDHPWVSPAEIQELIDQRSPGRWAVLARQPDDGPCPTLGLYEPQALAFLERNLLARGPEKACIAWLLDHPRTWVGPRHLHGTVDVNTPEELSAEKRTLAHICSVSAKKSRFIPGKGNHHNDEF